MASDKEHGSGEESDGSGDGDGSAGGVGREREADRVPGEFPERLLERELTPAVDLRFDDFMVPGAVRSQEVDGSAERTLDDKVVMDESEIEEAASQLESEDDLVPRGMELYQGDENDTYDSDVYRKTIDETEFSGPEVEMTTQTRSRTVSGGSRGTPGTEEGVRLVAQFQDRRDTYQT